MRTEALILLLLLGILAVLLLAACRTSPSSSALPGVQAEIAAVEAAVGALTPIPCPLPLTGEVEGETVECGVYTVLVDYDNPEAGTINLTYVLLRAQGDDPLPDPIVYLAGGPGQSSVLAAGGTTYGDLRQRRDLIFPAQRGTLFGSRLALDECVALLSEQIGNAELNSFVEEVSSRGELDRSLPYEQYLARYSAGAGAINGRCHEAFRQAGLDPAQFNTANSARDLVGLLAALGYESYNLHGTSYGTRLALETMRRHPDAPIRSAVLDSPVSPSTERLVRFAVAPHEALEQLFADCAADDACAAAYPDLLPRTVALLEALAETPLSAGEDAIGPQEVLRQLGDLGGTRANYLPRMIAELEAGETTTYVALRDGAVGTEPPEGALVSDTAAALVQRISLAGMTGDDPFAGLLVLKNVLDGGRETADPREGMKAAASNVLADAESLPEILDLIDSLTADDVQSLLGDGTGGAGDQPDAAAIQLVGDANAKNNAQFLLSGIACLEQLPFERVEDALAARDALPIPALGRSDVALATEVGNCTNYPMGAPDPSYHEPVSSDVPTLILQGEFDTRTPPDNGRALDKELDNATLVIVPQAGHETWGVGNCAAQIGIAFLTNPDQVPDLSCLDGRREKFSLPDDALE